MRLSTLMAITAVILTATTAFGASLWTENGSGLFTDQKARKAGDVVTVLIIESSSTSQKASTGYDKKLEHENGAGVGNIIKNIPPFEFESGQKSSASGSTSRQTNFTAKITATVTKVLPNGNLEIEAARTVSTNSEKQEIKLTGTIRPQDIAPDNTILSTYLADAKIECSGKGPIGDRQKEGLISKLLKLLF